MDPATVIGLAASVVDILWQIATPIGGWIKSRWLKRQVRRAVERVSLEFAERHHDAAGALVVSQEAIAHELARLTGAGAPVAPKVLADEWTANGLDRADATRYANEYVQALNDALLKIDGFRPLLQAGAIIATSGKVAEVEQLLRESADARRAGEEREVAVAYYTAAEEYYQAALVRSQGDTIDAMAHEHEARSLAAMALLCREPHVLKRFKELRGAFKELVEERYDDSKAAYQSGDRTTVDVALEELRRGCRDLQARVRELSR